MCEGGKAKHNALAERIIGPVKQNYDASIERAITHEELYLEGYAALIRLAKRLKDSSQDHEILALELAIYGWMPTILKVRPSKVFGKSFVGDVRKISSSNEAIEFLSGLSEIPPKGYSWVGASKMLHFINPRVFPIWDRRVADSFQIKSHNVNSRESYMAAIMAIAEALPHLKPEISHAIKRVKDRFSYSMSNTRAVELILFTIGRKTFP